jgi:hypothetical protein
MMGATDMNMTKVSLEQVQAQVQPMGGQQQVQAAAPQIE